MPPDRFDARSSSVLGTLCAAAVLFGYLNTLFNQTIAFAADEFRAGNAAQGVAGGVEIEIERAAAEEAGELAALLAEGVRVTDEGVVEMVKAFGREDRDTGIQPPREDKAVRERSPELRRSPCRLHRSDHPSGR